MKNRPDWTSSKNSGPDADVELGDANEAAEEYRARYRVARRYPIRDPLVVAARDAGVEVDQSDIELFTREASAPFVAVSPGSNGKSTVTTLLYHMCQAAGRRILAGGNLGEPALDLLDEDEPDIYCARTVELSAAANPQSAGRASRFCSTYHPITSTGTSDEEEYRQAKYRIFAEANPPWSTARTRPRPNASGGHLIVSSALALDEPEDGHYGIRREDG